MVGPNNNTGQLFHSIFANDPTRRLKYFGEIPEVVTPLWRPVVPEAQRH